MRKEIPKLVSLAVSLFDVEFWNATTSMPSSGRSRTTSVSISRESTAAAYSVCLFLDVAPYGGDVEGSSPSVPFRYVPSQYT